MARPKKKESEKRKPISATVAPLTHNEIMGRPGQTVGEKIDHLVAELHELRSAATPQSKPRNKRPRS